MASPEHPVPSIEVTTTIDLISDDLLQNILSRLPAKSFASANCVNRSWNRVCNRILCRPKLSSACLVNPSFQVAVDGVLNKILSEPIRPHFAIVSVDSDYITQRLGPNVPVIAKSAYGFMGRDAVSDEFKESEQTEDVTIMLMVGYLPGIKVKKIPLLKEVEEAPTWFVAETMTFSTSVSGYESPAAMIMFAGDQAQVTAIMKVMDRVMSQEMVIVGDYSCWFQHTNDCNAVALVFAKDRNKPTDIGETQFHAVLSSALLPVGDAYTVAFVEDDGTNSRLIARREGSQEDVDAETLLHQAYSKRGSLHKGPIYIGLEKARLTMTCVFHKVLRHPEEYTWVDGTCIERGDDFCVYYPDPTTGLCSVANVTL